MSQELITKIEEKLGGAIDLMTFDNAQQVVDYLSRYIQLKNLITTLILVFAVIVFLIIIEKSTKASNKLDEYDWEKKGFYISVNHIAMILTIVAGILLLVSLYCTIMAYNFPIAAIVEWLK